MTGLKVTIYNRNTEACSNCAQQIYDSITICIGEESNTSILFHHEHVFNNLSICDKFFIHFRQPFVVAMFLYFVS